MNYPLISEYVEAIKLAEENLDQLSYLRPILDDQGNPIMSIGNFAVVFKMKDERSGKLHALKCFIKEQEGRDKAYKLIADELEYVSSDFITPIKYLEKELFVDTSNCDVSEFPVLLMDWVEGVTLDKYIREHLHDQYALHLMTFQFCRLASWLMAQPFAHGDLKPDNILVKEDGSLVLVDYDGMYVPAMKGQKAREIGSPDYRHPLRTIEDFNENIDDFSLATIAMQLYAISLKPDLLTAAYGDTLLLTEADYLDMGKCQIMPHLLTLVSNAEFAKLLGLFFLSYSENSLSNVSFRTFKTSKPSKSIVSGTDVSTRLSDEDYLVDGIIDEFGVKYSSDGQRLLHGKDIESYHIKLGTKIICDNAFGTIKPIFAGRKLNYRLSSIIIPDSVTHIGNSAFMWCSRLTSITIPNSIIHIGDYAFASCTRLTSIIVDAHNHVFDSRENCNAIIHTASNTLIVGCSSTFIPDSIVGIGSNAFWGCNRLTSITIPNSVTRIGKQAFNDCSSLTSITVGAKNKEYDSRENCNAIVHTASDTLVIGCLGTSIPQTVTCIGDWAFSGCRNLKSISIPESVTHIGDWAFSGCWRLTNIDISNSVTQIGNNTFLGCENLTKITIPDSVTRIGNEAFLGCRNLRSITIPNSVISIGAEAFWGCERLTSITIPSTVTYVGKDAFENCDALAEIRIPAGSYDRFKKLLPGCETKFVEDYNLPLYVL